VILFSFFPVKALGLIERLFKGFGYGLVLGTVFGFGVFVLFSALNTLGFVKINAASVAGLVFGVSTIAGPAMEYKRWMEERNREG